MSQLMDTETLRSLLEEGTDEKASVASLEECEVIRVVWEPWRTTVGLLLRESTFHYESVLHVLVAAEVSALAYRSRRTHQVLGARNIDALKVSERDQISVDIATGFQSNISFSCRFLAVVSGVAVVDSETTPDYGDLSPYELALLQPGPTIDIQVRSVGSIGDLARLKQ